MLKSLAIKYILFGIMIFLIILSFFFTQFFIYVSIIAILIFIVKEVIEDLKERENNKEEIKVKEKQIRKLYNELKDFLEFLFSKDYFFVSRPLDEKLKYNTDNFIQKQNEFNKIFGMVFDNSIRQHKKILLFQARISIEYWVHHERIVKVRVNNNSQEFRTYNEINKKHL